MVMLSPHPQTVSLFRAGVTFRRRASISRVPPLDGAGWRPEELHMTVEYRLDGGVLPRRLADILRPELASVATEIVAEIRAKIPAYARPLDSPYGKSIKAGVQHAISLFTEQIANPDASAQKCYDVHTKLGQHEMREGRSLD